jgi:hypothetical protein
MTNKQIKGLKANPYDENNMLGLGEISEILFFSF